MRVHAGVINARVYSVTRSDFSAETFRGNYFCLLFQALIDRKEVNALHQHDECKASTASLIPASIAILT